MTKAKYNKGDKAIITKHLNTPCLEGTIITIVGLCFTSKDGSNVYKFKFDDNSLGWIEESCMKPYKY